MKKKLVNLLVAAALSLPMTSANLGCIINKNRVEQLIVDINADVRMDLETMTKSVFCVKNKGTYSSDGTDKGDIQTLEGYGTAFAYARKDDGYTYLISNKHVAKGPEKENIVTPGSFFPSQYSKMDEKLTLVDNREDTKTSDDIEVELVRYDEKLDIAILRTTEKLPIASDQYSMINFEPEINDRVLVTGYPLGLLEATTEGHISNKKHEFVDESSYVVLDLTGTFGNSGSAYFIRRGGKLYWGGLVGAKLMEFNSPATLFMLGIPIDTFKHLL